MSLNSTPASGRMPLASSSSSTVTKRYPSACRASTMARAASTEVG